MKFRDVKIGQWFDFIDPNSSLNSFYERCQKISTRKYRWENPIRCSLNPDEYLSTQVGTIDVEVFNVESVKMHTDTQKLEHAIKYANRTHRRFDNTDEQDDNWYVLYRAKKFLERIGFAEWIMPPGRYAGRDDVSPYHTETITLHNADDCEREAEYLNAGDTYAETILAESGVAFVGCWGGWYESVENEYCKENNVVRCGYCSEFVPTNADDWSLSECQCGHYVSGEKIPDVGSQLENVTELEENDYHTLWLCDERLATHETKSQNTLIFVKLEYLEEHGEEIVKELGKYYVSIKAVNPSMAKKGGKEACQSIDMDYDEYRKLPVDVRAMILMDYGTSATLWERCGNSAHKLLIEANKELQLVFMLGGFKLDAAQNAIGSTGWDFMRGDILAGLKTCNTPEADIMRKMQGE